MNIEKPNFKKICLMHLQALTNFPYIEKDFDAITDYELLCKVVDYLNKVIYNNNEQNTVVENLYNAFVELKEYVDNYFDDLDIEDEVNNKLEEMLENGQLDSMLERILEMTFVYTYDNKYILQSANIPDGSIVRLNGDEFFNDGIINYYKVLSQPNQLFDINNTTRVNAYYNAAGQQMSDNNNTSFVGIRLPQGYITISSNKTLNKLIGFTSGDFSEGVVLSSPNIGTEFTFNNDGTYQYFAFYCVNSNLNGLQVMMNKGQTALPYEDYYSVKITDINMNSGQIASLINNYKLDDSYVAEDIIISEHICSDENTYTKYWITHIPRYDKNGNINELKLGFANNDAHQFLAGSTAKQFSDLKNSTLVINAGVSYSDDFINENTGTHVEYDGLEMQGLRVLNHILVSDDLSSTVGAYWYKKDHYALGIDEDGTLVSFGTPDANGDIIQTYSESQQLNCKYVTSAFTPVMIDGISQKNILPYTNKWVEDGHDVYYPRQIIGQNTTTKDIYIITSNGKGTRLTSGSDTQIIDKGLTIDYCIATLKSLGCDFAYQLDEGGSTSLVYRGVPINDPTDDSGKSFRVLSDFLYVSKKILTDKDKDIAYLNNELGKLKNDIKRLHNKLYLSVDSDYPFEIQRWEENHLKNSLNLRSYGLEYYDFSNNKRLFGIDANGFIESQYGKNGIFSATAKGVYSSDAINSPYSNIFIYPLDQEDAPYSTVNALVMSFVLWDDFSNNQMIQLALPHAADPVTDGHKPKYRTKTRSGSSYVWSDWIEIG